MKTQPGSTDRDRRQVLGELTGEIIRAFHVLRRIEERLHGEAWSSEAERAVLFALHAGPQTMPALARERALTRQRVQQIVAVLERDGWIERRDNPLSERSPLYVLSAAGNDYVRGMLRKEHRRFRDVLHGSSVRRLQTTLAVLRELRAELED